MLPAALRRTVPFVVAAVVAAGVPALTLTTSADAAPAVTRAASVPAATGTPAADAAAGLVATALATPLPSFRLDRTRRISVPARDYVASRITDASVRSALATTPTVAESEAGADPTRISLPAPDGTEVVFAVVEDSVMEPGLQAAHPELRTYAGTGVTDPTDTIRMTVTPLGLSASVRSTRGNRVWYVDPAYWGKGVTAHISYLRSAVPAAQRYDEKDVQGPELASRARTVEQARRAGALVTQRTYRMAWVTTPAYATDFPGAVLAEKVKTVNRTNAIYMDDVAIKFVLVDGTDDLNLDTLAKATGANGPCGANGCLTEDNIASCGGTLNRVNFPTGQIIGADRYDIGHIGSGEGSGGVARLAAVGGEFKSSGCTALDEPKGDFYAVDFFAHEVGHQMGGNHTFDGNNGSCAAPNRNAPTSVEPGSGSTVMAYAGICFNDDLQPHTDPYFSQRTIDEFVATTSAAPTMLTEQQSINLRDFAGTDSFVLSYPGNPVTQTITNGTNYTAAGLQAALLALTGKAVTVSPYDGGDTLDGNGFVAEWPDTSNPPRLQLSGFNGATGFLGVLVEGGPTGNQGTAVTTANHKPEVDAGPDKSIPIQTPFVLTGSATDVDPGDQAALTYLWEQNDSGIPGDPILDTGPGTLLGSPVKIAGPLFRVFGTFADVSDTDTLLYESPGENLVDGTPSRSFPDLQQVLDDNTNAETGTCPVPTTDPTSGMEGDALDCYSEFLPDAVYATSLLAGELNFRLTVRDGDPTGGGTGFDDLTLTPDPTVGPFAVTSRSTAGDPAMAGATETVEWDVAGTDAAEFAPTVKISLSLDGGQTFPYVVAASTANDGEEAITLPRFNSTQARFKVEAIDNYFYDTNDADFVIEGGVDPVDPVAPQTVITGGVPKRGFVTGTTATYTFTSSIAGSRYGCSLDGRGFPCSDGRLQLKRLRPGTHVLKIAAVSPDGLVDRTPARREFSVLAGERPTTRRSKGWTSVRDVKSSGSIYLQTRQKGRTLSYSIQRAKRVAFLLHRGPGFGRVAIEINGKRLKVVNLRGPARRGFLYTSGSFPAARSGTLTIRTLDAKKRVVVDGVGSFVIPTS